MADTVVGRWTIRLAIRRGLLKDALWRLGYRRGWHAYYHSPAAKRKFRKRPERREELAIKWHKLEEEATALVAKRREQVAAAERVIARHTPVTGVSDKGADFVAGFEGFSAKAYWDIDHYSIGYGTRAHSSIEVISRAEARERLEAHLNETAAPAVLGLAKQIGLKLAQHELDALASFVYNLGEGSIGPGWTMGQAIRSKDRHRIADAFLHPNYDDAGGETLPGLTRRRKAERAMYLGGS